MRREHLAVAQRAFAVPVAERWTIVALWTLVALLAIRLIVIGVDVATTPTNGFAAYYTAARLVSEGADARRFYDDDWFEDQVLAHGLDVADIYHVNPPTTAMMLLPLAAFDAARAKTIWTIFSILCLIGSLGLLIRQLHIRGPLLPAVLALALAYQPVLANLRQGQAYLFLLGLLTLAWSGYRQAHMGILGSALGLLLVLKTAVVLLWLLLLIERRWRVLLTGLATLLAGVSLSFIWSSADAWTTYARLLSGLGSRAEIAVTAYQSQPSLIRHLLLFDPRWNPDPIADLPLLAHLFITVSIVGAIGMSIVTTRIARCRDLPFGAMITASLILSPVSADYHYTLLLLPIVVLVVWSREHASLPFWALLVLATLLIGANLPYQSPRFSDGGAALLAYPKLYGAWILLALFVWASCKKAVDDRHSTIAGKAGT